MIYLSGYNVARFIPLTEMNFGGIYSLDDFKNLKGSSILFYGSLVVTPLPITYNLHNPFGYYDYGWVWIQSTNSISSSNLASLNLEARYAFHNSNSKSKILAFAKILVGTSYDNFKIITHTRYSTFCYTSRYCSTYVSSVWSETVFFILNSSLGLSLNTQII